MQTTTESYFHACSSTTGCTARDTCEDSGGLCDSTESSEHYNLHTQSITTHTLPK